MRLLRYEIKYLAIIFSTMLVSRKDRLTVCAITLLLSMALVFAFVHRSQHIVAWPIVIVLHVVCAGLANIFISLRIKYLVAHSIMAVSALNKREIFVYRFFLALFSFIVVFCIFSFEHIFLSLAQFVIIAGVWGASFLYAHSLENRAGRVLKFSPRIRGHSAKILSNKKIQFFAKIFLVAGICILSFYQKTEADRTRCFSVCYAMVVFLCFFKPHNARRAAFGVMMGEKVLKSAWRENITRIYGVLFLSTPIVFFPSLWGIALKTIVPVGCLAFVMSVFVTLHFRVRSERWAQIALSADVALLLVTALCALPAVMPVFVLQCARLVSLNRRSLWRVLG